MHRSSNAYFIANALFMEGQKPTPAQAVILRSLDYECQNYCASLVQENKEQMEMEL